jgi:hypothetical protein
MSVVVSDSQSGKIFLLSKGADEAILPLAYPGNHLFCSVQNSHFCSLFVDLIFFKILCMDANQFCLDS